MAETTQSALPYDMEFLLRAAEFSQPARDALDIVADRLKAVAEFQLQVARERLKQKDPAAVAASAESEGLDLA